MVKTIETLQEALNALSKLVGDSDKIEGAPKPLGSDGPVPNADWREVRRDLSDVPRGERWLIRKRGTGRGNKVHGKWANDNQKNNYIAVCLLKEDSTALQGYSATQLQASRELDARQWDLLRRYEEVLKFKEDMLNGISELQKRQMSIIGDSIQHANSSTQSANLIAELTKAHAEILDDLSEAKADNNTAKSVVHIINRIVTYVQLRRVKSWAELQAIPELSKDIEDFFKWKDERDAPAPSDKKD